MLECFEILPIDIDATIVNFFFIIVKTHQRLPWVAICGNPHPWHGVIWSPRFRCYIYGVFPKKIKIISNGTNACFSKVQENQILHSSYLNGVPIRPIFLLSMFFITFFCSNVYKIFMFTSLFI